MKYALAILIAVGLALPTDVSFAATQAMQGASTLSAPGVELVAKKKVKKAKKKSKTKVAKK